MRASIGVLVGGLGAEAEGHRLGANYNAVQVTVKQMLE